MDFPRISEIKPNADMTLLVKFENGVSKVFDVKPYMQMHKMFEALKDGDIFNRVHTEHSGKVIVWDKCLDIDGADAWRYGQKI
jgi:hypothetical protein